MRKTGLLAIALFVGMVVLGLSSVAAADDSVANFDYQAEGRNVLFDYTGTEGSEYRWSFGDGQGFVGQSPTHRYADYGNYSVTVEVVKFGGGTFSVTKDILVPADLVNVHDHEINVGPFTWGGIWIMVSAVIMFALYQNNITLFRRDISEAIIPLWFLFGLGLWLGVLDGALMDIFGG